MIPQGNDRLNLALVLSSTRSSIKQMEILLVAKLNTSKGVAR